MPISAVHNPKTPCKNAGFSVLEMLVVLVIMGLMLSLVGARMMTSLDATRFARTVDAAAADIRLIRADAMLTRQPRYIVTDKSMRSSELENIPKSHIRALTVPSDWRVAGGTIYIAPSGVCTGGQIRITGGGRAADYAITAPKCAVTRIAAGGA